MATIHIMHGFIGFGKSTTAKKLAKEYKAVRLATDVINVALFGRNPARDGFGDYWVKIRDLIWDIAKETIENGVNVVIDIGHWRKDERLESWERAKQITPNVIFHAVQCDMSTARERTILRTKNDPTSYEVSDKDFDKNTKWFEPIQDDEAKNYKIVYHDNTPPRKI